MNRIVIVGATSAIAHAAARLWAEQGAALFLVGRSVARLEANAADLRVRGAASVAVHAMDATEDAVHAPMLAAAIAALGESGGVDVALIAHGTLPDQRQCETDLARLHAEIETNGVSVCLLSQLFANHFVAQGAGALAVIGSVAGDRGRQSNYAYGAAKGMVARFTEGLRNRVAKSGVQVLLVKPGFVDTPMTAEFEKKGLLWAQPEAIAAGMLRAIAAKRDVVYLPWFWRWIMLIIRHIPERVFKRLSL
jgi:decaprenylphospho-beta-D-erythro-pentofuranosid-2-ulose 2-reductase